MVTGETVVAHVGLDVSEPAGLFMERHRDSQICLSVGQGRSMDMTVYHFCHSVMEPGVPLPALPLGWYSLEARLIDIQGIVAANAINAFAVVASADVGGETKNSSSYSSSSGGGGDNAIDLYNHVRGECVARVMPQNPPSMETFLKCMVNTAIELGIPTFSPNEFGS